MSSTKSYPAIGAMFEHFNLTKITLHVKSGKEITIREVKITNDPEKLWICPKCNEVNSDTFETKLCANCDYNE